VLKKATWFVAASVALTALVGYVVSVQRRPSHAGYAWLVFGPEAQVRVLVSVAGDTITLQRFAGELPIGPKEQFKDRGQPLEISLEDPDGVTSYVIRKCASPATGGPREGTPEELFVNVEVRGPVTYRQYCDIPTMARELEKAPVSHFHGPLAIGPTTVNWEIPSDLALCRGEEGTDLRAFIGTMDAARGCWVVVKTHQDADTCSFPGGVRPVADVEFPAKQSGAPPIKRRYVLDQFC
jgi:hypothetical protein